MKKINVAELLKDCPKGMELDCILLDGSVVFEDISEDDEYPIGIRLKNGDYTNLTKYGQYLNLEEAKCVIFPKGKTTWEGFVPPCKFKVGDKITNGKTSITIGYIDNEYYYEIGRSIATRLLIKNQDEWELVPNKFDITTLVPFESRVLIRNDKNQYWIPAFWGYKRADGYTTTFGWCKYCIPFEGNEYLLETNKDCDKYYKTWK